MSLPITSRVIKLMPLTYRSVLSRPSIPSRHLHMTGPTTFPSTLLANRIPGIASEYLTKDHFSLKADAQGRGLDTRGNRNDLVSRLHAFDLLNQSSSRPFTTARPTPPSPTDRATSTRKFNTTRALKMNKDASPVDFTFLPSTMTNHIIEEESEVTTYGWADSWDKGFRVPVLTNKNGLVEEKIESIMDGLRVVAPGIGGTVLIHD